MILENVVLLNYTGLKIAFSAIDRDAVTPPVNYVYIRLYVCICVHIYITKNSTAFQRVCMYYILVFIDYQKIKLLRQK